MTTKKEILAAIARFTTDRETLKDSAHSIAMMIIRHAAPKEAGEGCGSGNGDCTTALDLVRAMPNSWQVQMTAWFKAFSPIKVLVGTGKAEFRADYKAIKANDPSRLDAWDIATAEATRFDKVGRKETTAEDLYDFDKLLAASTVGRAKALQKKIDDGDVKPEDVDSVKALIAVLKSINVPRVTIAANEDTKGEEGKSEGEAPLTNMSAAA